MTKEAKISTIEQVSGDGQKWNGIYYHNLTMDNGDRINIGKKGLFQVGEQFHYELLETGKRFNKASRVNPEWKEQKEASETGQNNTNGKNKSFALSYAKDFIIPFAQAGLFTEPEKAAQVTIKVAELFNSWLDGAN